MLHNLFNRAHRRKASISRIIHTLQEIACLLIGVGVIALLVWHVGGAVFGPDGLGASATEWLLAWWA